MESKILSGKKKRNGLKKIRYSACIERFIFEWEVPGAIGNLARKYPEKVTKAFSYLLKNTTDEKIILQ